MVRYAPDVGNNFISPGSGKDSNVSAGFVKDLYLDAVGSRTTFARLRNKLLSIDPSVDLFNLLPADQQKVRDQFVNDSTQAAISTFNRLAANQGTRTSNISTPFVFSFQNYGIQFPGPATFYNQTRGRSKQSSINQDRFVLMVPPESFDVSVPNSPQTISTINGLTYTHAGPIELDEISFSGFFPFLIGPRSSWPSFIPEYFINQSNSQSIGASKVFTYRSPERWVKELVTAMRANQPIVFSVYAVDDDTNNFAITSGGMIIQPVVCTVASFDWNMGVGVGGSRRDIEYNITLKRWRRQQVRVTNFVQQATNNRGATGNTRGDNGPQFRKYTVKAGDYLVKIAQNLLGDGRRWREIYNLNKGLIGNNPNLLSVGQVLKIPKK